VLHTGFVNDHIHVTVRRQKPDGTAVIDIVVFPRIEWVDIITCYA
jgi:hypothetical protein